MIPGRYWDSVTFVGWLSQEPDKFDLCEQVIDLAKAGRCRIVTSALTFAEVYWMKRSKKLPPEQQKAITDLFNYSWVIPVELDRPIAEFARQLIWNLNVKSWDAVHVASAMKARRLGAIDCFDTFDDGLIGLTGRLTDSDLILAKPSFPARLDFSSPIEPKQLSSQSLPDVPRSDFRPERALPATPQGDPKPQQPDSSHRGIRPAQSGE